MKFCCELKIYALFPISGIDTHCELKTFALFPSSRCIQMNYYCELRIYPPLLAEAGYILIDYQL